ncbi:probable serine/threonine-protein kinase At1g54610 isoform X2 [Telopea speciosissima]|uniref:probable serine/threonine-protein kinase At1g54610 isoform X2 n=1 Tax=Telopea speciosissima TaxID=54955 RepID=UPI001CC6B505|nr:probable serine/threonine-protein kinase At1g54610 isoform X2 [Telopea speciosissima]
MGCIVCKRVAGDGRERSGVSEDGRERSGVSEDGQVKAEEQPADASNTATVNDSRIRKEGVRRGRERIHRHRTGDFAPPPLQQQPELRKPKSNHKPKPKPNTNPALRNEQGWPSWLSAVAGEAIKGWTPRRADTFEKLDKIGQGTYSNVYKARDLISGKIVALKKVRFDNLEPESVKFMAREILVLRRLEHPNVVKLEGLVTSRMSCSLYLVFEYMEHDLAGLAACPGIKFTEPQVKCYMKQLLSGLEHCHNQGVLHRDIKGSNLLLDNEGVLKLADFGLAAFYGLDHRQPMTSRVVTLWYRPPELLLGATYYGVGVDLWSAGCIFAELLAGKPIMPGRTEVEQLHKIFKLCGSPSEEYWKKSKLPHATIFKPQQPYRRCLAETYNDFPPSALSLIETLLSIDPDERGTATVALNSDFFTTEPYACEPSILPKYPPTKEMDMKLRDEATRRQRGLNGKANAAGGAKRARVRDQGGRAVPAPEANAELQVNLDRRRLIVQANAKSKSEKFPPPHQDGAVGYPLDTSHDATVSFVAHDTSFASSVFYPKAAGVPFSGPQRKPDVAGVPFGRKTKVPQVATSRMFVRAFKPSIGLSMDLRNKGKERVSEVFGTGK